MIEDYLISIAVKDCPQPPSKEELSGNLFNPLYLGIKRVEGFSEEFKLRHVYLVYSKNLDNFKKNLRKIKGLEKIFIMVTDERTGTKY